MKDRLLDFDRLKFEVRKIMRYDDVGDYFDNTIVAYDFNDDVISNAIFLHEFIEYTLIKSSGVDPSLIDTFDTEPESRKRYPKEYALYRKFHTMANGIERQFIENLGLKWDEYDKKINTTRVKAAIGKITSEIHKSHPDSKEIDRSKRIIRREVGK